MADEAPKTVAPYASFKSVVNFLDKLKESYPPFVLPQQIDRSIWGQWFSGGYGPQIIQALKFLGLVDAKGRPVGDFAMLVHEPDSRPGYMRAYFEQKYADVLALDLSTATMGQLQAIFREGYGVTGDTLRKAIVFFLHGAEFAGIPVGDHLRQGKRASNGAPTARRKATGSTRRSGKGSAPPSAPPAADFVDLKRRYLEALIKKVEEGDTDADLLGRVQTLLFEQAEQEKNPTRVQASKPEPES